MFPYRPPQDTQLAFHRSWFVWRDGCFEVMYLWRRWQTVFFCISEERPEI